MDEIPNNRAEAQILADSVGVAYYANNYGVGYKTVYCVKRGTPIKELGERVAAGNAWGKEETKGLISALNNAYQNGLNSRVKKADHVKEIIDEAVKPLIEQLEKYVQTAVSKKS